MNEVKQPLNQENAMIQGNKPQGELDVVKEHWSKQAQQENVENRRYVSWMNYPLIEQEYINRRYSEGPGTNWLTYVREKYMPGTLSWGLTLGCGDGGLERHAIKIGLCQYFDAFDLADGAIAAAKGHAKQHGISENIGYAVANINEIVLEENKYDVVFASMSAHHFSALEHVFSEVRRALKPNGFFVLNEYIGPTQFQWTDQQLKLINDLLTILPRKYREYLQSPGHYKEVALKPTISEMNAIDPSEAIRSAEIVPLLSDFFDLIEKDDFGGTILQILLQDIVGNFDIGREEDTAIIRLLCYFERTLIEHGVIPSDFSLVIARNNK